MSTTRRDQALPLDDRAAHVLEERNRAFRVLYDTVLEVEGASEGQVYAILCRNLRLICQAELACLTAYDPENRTLVLEAVDGVDGSCSSCGRQALTNRADVDDEMLYRFTAQQVRSCFRHQDCPIDRMWAERNPGAPTCELVNFYCLSSIREGELVAVGRVQLPTSTKLRLKDVVDTYMNLAGVILQRVNAVKAVREGRALLSTIINTTKEAIFAISDDGRVSISNPAAEEMFERSCDEMVGQPAAALITSDCSEERQTSTAPCSVTSEHRGLIGRTCELSGLRRDGALFPIEVSFSQGQHNARQMVVAVARDITERKRAAMQLEEMHRKLLDASRHAGMAEVATSVLHNVGNALNSVNVSAELIHDKIAASRLNQIGRVACLLDEHQEDLGTFLVQDPRGRQVPIYLRELATCLNDEKCWILEEVRSLRDSVGHIKEIVAAQQAHAGMSGFVESIRVEDLVETALSMSLLTPEAGDIRVTKRYDTLQTITVDKHKLLQILVNLVRNAKESLLERGGHDLELTVRITTAQSDRIRIAVIDNGLGIEPSNLNRIFTYGFTTKHDGHGFGLHASALTATELGGELTVTSEGLGKGAAFTLDIPFCRREA